MGRPLKIREDSPAYGQQKKGQTKLTFSLDQAHADEIRRKAEEEGKTISEWLRDMTIRNLGIFIAVHLAYHWLNGSEDWIGDGISSAMANGARIITFAGDIISQLISQ
jgi:hypothetical protein